MPTISMFQGIVVKMYRSITEHEPPHIHTWYQGQEAKFSVLDCSCLGGTFPANKRRLVEAWIELRREELLADWELARLGLELEKIDPLH